MAGQVAQFHPEYRGSGHARRYQTVVASIATLGGFLFGYDTGVIAGALIYIARDLGLTPTTQGLVVSSLLVGAAFGATFGGKLADRLGRRNAIHYAAVVFMVGTLGSALAPGALVMVVSRVILGLAVGCVSATVPVYLGEIAPPQRRGRLVNQNELMIVIGQLVATIINATVIHIVSGDVAWRWMLGLGVIPAVALWVGTMFIPETPRWYALHGHYREAAQVLRRVHEPDEADRELEHMRHAATQPRAHEGRSGWGYLRARWVRLLFVIGVGIAVCQQITGVNTVVYYAPTILQSTGLGASASVTASISIGAVGLVAVGVGMVLVGRIHRRPMMITGLVGTTTSLLAVALLFLLPTSTTRSYVILVAMLAFIAFQQCFVSVITWLLLSEIFPMRIRGFAMGVAVFVLWGFNFGISLSFPILNSSAGPTWTFAVFVLLGIAALAFTTTSVPETKGRSLEQIETGFRERYGN